MTTDALVGRRLANFQIERPLGRGGMAQVYYGQDVKLRRPVAVKVIDARYRDNPTYAERFVREAQAIATWRHENIIQIYYADDQDGFYYFVMEYVDGVDLGKLLARYEKRGELIPQAEALRIGWSVASALDYAHKRGIIHRDVKPSNILVAHDGRVVLADFGLAMDAEQGSMGEVMGSAHYVAPEQARNSASAVPQSDTYSLGVVLYEMLTGQVPFDDPSSTTIAVQHLTLPPPPPRQINPQLNSETETVLLKALRKKPEERFQTAPQLLEALEAALYEPATLPASLKETQVSGLPPTARRKTWLYLGVGLGLLVPALVILFLAGLFFFGGDGNGGDDPLTTPSLAAGNLAITTTLQPGRTPLIATSTFTPGPQAQATSTSPPPPAATPTPEPQLLAYTIEDFSDNPQGKWQYFWTPSGQSAWRKLEFGERRGYGACWFARDYVRICQDAGHPGFNEDIAWYWASPTSGPLEVIVRAAKKSQDRGGDGVTLAVYRNPPGSLGTGGQLLLEKSIAGADNVGFTETLQIEEMQEGESLFFVIHHNGNDNSDNIAFDARICLYQCPRS